MGKHLPPSENKHLKEPKFDYLNIPLTEGKNAHGRDAINTLTPLNIILVLLGAAFLIAGCILASQDILSLILFIASIISAGAGIFYKAFEKLCRIKPLEEEVAISVSVIILMALGRFGASAAVMVLFALYCIAYAWIEQKSDSVLDSLRIKLPDKVKLVTENGIETQESELITVDDVILVDVGEIIPADGLIIEGMSSLDLSELAGPGVTRTVSEGNRVLSGSVNLSAPLRLKVEKIYMESSAVRITELLENAGKYKTSISKFAEKFDKYFVPFCFIAAFLIGIVPPIFSGEWTRWLSSAAILFAVSGSGALIHSIQFAFNCALADAASKGVVVKGLRFLESFAKTKTLIFNKTGTLTEGKYRLVDIEPRGISEDELLYLAASAERFSAHPIALAICHAEGTYTRPENSDENFEEIQGRGVSVWIGKRHVFVGNAALLEENGISCEIPKKGGAAIHVAVNGKYCGYFLVVDRIREAAFDAIEAMRVQGVKNVVMLTADMRSVARPLASALNLDMVKAELGEAGKISAVEYLLATKAERSALAFVCNRAEDEEALTRADVGVSLGALGSEASMESADIMVMSQDLKKLPETMRLAYRAFFTSGTNLLASFACKLVVVFLAITGSMGVVPAVCIDFLVSIFCFGNVLRSLYIGNERK